MAENKEKTKNKKNERNWGKMGGKECNFYGFVTKKEGRLRGTKKDLRSYQSTIAEIMGHHN